MILFQFEIISTPKAAKEIPIASQPFTSALLALSKASFDNTLEDSAICEELFACFSALTEIFFTVSDCLIADSDCR